MRLLILILSVSALLPELSVADDHAVISRYVSNDTLFVGWIDTQKTDATGFGAFLEKYGNAVSDLTPATQLLNAANAVGVRKIYFLGTQDVLSTSQPVFVLPSTPEKVDAIHVVASAGIIEQDLIVRNDGSNVLVGLEDAVNACVNGKHGGFPENIALAIKQMPHPSGIVFNPSAGPTTRMLKTITPAILKSMSAVDSKDAIPLLEQFAALKSASLSMSIPPKGVVLRMETTHDSSANSLVGTMNGLLQKVSPVHHQGLSFQSKEASVVFESNDQESLHNAILCLMDVFGPRLRPAEINLNQIGQALHKFHEVYSSFPPQALADNKGKKLLSWRVLLLPFLGENELYEKFNLDEPWDSDHNRKLISEIPSAFKDSNAAAPGTTRMQTPLVKNSVFGKRGSGVSYREITDGTSNTLMVVQVTKRNAVTWTKPDDVVVNSDAVAADWVSAGNDYFQALMCDGSVREFSTAISNATLLKLLTISGDEIIDADELK